MKKLTNALYSGCIALCCHYNVYAGFDAQIQTRMQRDDIPGMQVCFIEKDRLLACKAYGWARVGQRAMSNDSVFIWASVSKTITAAAQMKAQELGHLDVDANINNWLPFTVNNTRGGTVTTRSLANHTSGAFDDLRVGGQFLMDTFRVTGYRDPAISLATAMEDYFTNNRAFTRPVGRRHSYSNMGAALGGYVVEEAVGLYFGDFVADEFFIPLGMDTASFWITDIPRHLHAHHYEGYYNNWSRTNFYSFSDYPNGGLRGSARDLSRFLAMIANGGACNNIRILSQSTVNDMLTLQPQQNGNAGLPQLYGFYRDSTTSNAWTGHNGSEENVASQMWFRESDGIGFVAFTNHENFTTQMKNLLKNYAVSLKGSAGVNACSN